MTEQQQAEATETAPPAETQTTEDTQPARLPDDHPLVKTLAAQKEAIRDLKAQVATASDGSRTAEERIAALEERAVKAERAALMKSVQAAHGITDEDAALFLTASDEETLKKQAERLAARNEQVKRNGNHVPREGTTPTATPNDERAAVQALFGGGG